MLILTVPILFPIAVSLGIDPVWFGIYIIIVAEIGLITPPLGVNVYVIKTVAQDVPLGKIFLGCMPFVLGMLWIYFGHCDISRNCSVSGALTQTRARGPCVLCLCIAQLTRQ